MCTGQTPTSPVKTPTSPVHRTVERALPCGPLAAAQGSARFHSGPPDFTVDHGRGAGGAQGRHRGDGQADRGAGWRLANRGAQWSERGEMSLARGRKSSPPGNLTRPSRRPRWASRGGSTPGESREADEMLREADEMLLRAREADHEMLREAGGDVACCGVPSERDAHAGNARFGGGATADARALQGERPVSALVASWKAVRS